MCENVLSAVRKGEGGEGEEGEREGGRKKREGGGGREGEGREKCF